MKKILFLLLSLIVTSSHVLSAGTVSFDQLATSSDLTATKYNADLNKIFQDHNSNIQSSNIANDTVAEVDMADDANPRIRTYEGGSCEKVYTGLLPTTTSGTLTGSVPSGTAYPLGYRVVKSSSTPKTWSASKWTFVDIDINGDFTFSEVALEGATPAVATNSIRLARVSTDATQVGSVQDLRTTSCTTGTFDGTAASTTSNVSLNEVLRTGQPVRRFSIAGRTPQGWAQGLFVSFDTISTFKVISGSAYINGVYRFVSTDITVTTGTDTPNAGISGLDTGTVTGGPLRYYVYAVADQDSVETYSITYSLSSSAPSGLTNYRLIGAINTDATNFFTSKDMVTVHAVSERELIGGWINFDGQGSGTILNSYNVASILENAAGDYSISWDADFNNATYAVVCTHSQQGSTTNGAADSIQALTAGVARMNIKNIADSAVDGNPTVCIAAGDTRR